MMIYEILKRAFKNFMRDDALNLGAAFSFYTALALSPVLIFFVWVTGLLGPEARDGLVGVIQESVGPQAGEIIRTVAEEAADRPAQGNVAALAGFAMVIIAATGLVLQLRKALNRIWNVTPHGGSVARMILKRLLSLSILIIAGLVMMSSLVFGTALTLIVEDRRILQFGNYVIVFLVYWIIFAILYRFLPDADISPQPLWVGSFVTALLFGLGRIVLDFYLTSGEVGSAYGVAGSFVALLVWVYYSSLIVFFGAELTQSYAAVKGQTIKPAA